MRIGIRFCIISFWVALIFGILYFPYSLFFPEKKNIRVFAWGDILDPEVIAEFEKETKIKVHLNYYSSNEELLVKLRATRGKEYDLIIPSDYAVSALIKEELLKPLDHSKLTFLGSLNPLLLGHFFDPENRYSIPFEWEIFGIGIDQDYFKNRSFEPGLGLIFNPEENYKIAMVNDPLEAIFLATLFLDGKTEEIEPMQLQKIKELLITQSNWVEAYASFRGDYFLATRNCPVAVASSSYILRAMRLFPFIEFIIPKEGTFITIENFSIPKESKKEREVYTFINYLLRPESLARHYKTFGFFPALQNSLHLLDADEKTLSLINSSAKDFKKYYFLKNILPSKDVRNLWVEVKTFGE